MKKFVLFVLFFGFSIAANASLISLDDAGFGADSVTSDTESGLDWLDLNFSTGLSYNQLIAETSGGGMFDGFRLAEISEIQTLFDAAGLPAIGSTTSDFGAVDALIDLIGSTSNQGSFLQSLGITATPGEGSGHLVTGLDFFTSGGIPFYVLTEGLTYANNTSFDTVGGWLVRDVAAVPEPGLPMLMFGGLMAIFVTRRMRSVG